MKGPSSLAAARAGVEQRVEALEREQLPEEGCAHERRRVGRERAERADQHAVQRGVGLTLLGDLVGGFEHGDRVGQAAVVLPELAVAVDGLGLGDDVEVAAAAVALERDVGRGLEPGAEAAAGLADALGDRADLAVTLREDGDDAVGLTELDRAQDHTLIPVQAHMTSV